MQQDTRQNGLSKTALFQQYIQSKENELWFFQNTHTNKKYKALPCSIKPRKMNDNPLIMAQIISKYGKEKQSLLKIDGNQSQVNMLPRHFTPKMEQRSGFRSKRRNKSSSKDLCSSFDETIKHKQKTPKSIKAELYFSRELRAALRSPRMSLTIPQYIAYRCRHSSNKLYN